MRRLPPKPPRSAHDLAAPILLSPPHLTGREKAAVAASLASGWLAPAGPTPRAFEAAFAEATGFAHVLGVASGTAALTLAFRVLEIGPGDEVWVPGFTFIASIAPAVQLGARPRFLDVCPGSWTLDAALLAAELRAAARQGRLPKAVVAVDIYGQCAALHEIAPLCAGYGVAVISDSAEGLGATQAGLPAGRGALLAAFSFNGNKIITAGGGGALASDDALLIARARALADQAKSPAPHYEHETTGYSFGLSSLLAAVGLAQLSKLADRVARRRAIFARYQEALEDLPGLAFMPEAAWGRSSRWLSALLIDPAGFGMDADGLRRVLAAGGIETRPAFKPLHMQPVFRDAPRVGGKVAEALFAKGLCLPSGSGMAPAAQHRVIRAIRAAARG
ncbi:MAG: DegT/DnrJ/EryC1/StrS family aminotransferase [Roseomonas sp.]|nr:DegT/DnrJ/EryC1/StrS family aminotransferase [Roseomonas sp.]MCA3328571.1 DegT/DnrJ/EryC1/StrS family aminotransferase [Roseomonas sp.]MCA3331562.1 DegT/DnrJ/EryC1/StrS family aminotransferase [Roseomonas sp.]MCA3336395.1 DegT/DnrJ/EryC1/StrS family aminotransferase [Roseomonas sp.]MCA3346195.1 DegT/DnrJ/EryC1/StrS family aminotransferase [Roseomonas sp.]